MPRDCKAHVVTLVILGPVVQVDLPAQKARGGPKEKLVPRGTPVKLVWWVIQETSELQETAAHLDKQDLQVPLETQVQLDCQESRDPLDKLALLELLDPQALQAPRVMMEMKEKMVFLAVPVSKGTQAPRAHLDPQEILEYRAKLEHLVHWVRRDREERREQLDPQERGVRKAPQALRETLDQWAQWGNLDRLEQLVMRDHQVPMDLQEPLDLLGLKETQVPEAFLARRESRDPEATRVSQERGVTQETRAQLAPRATLARLDQRDPLVHRDSQALTETLVHWAHLECKGLLERKAILVYLDLKDPKEIVDLQDSLTQSSLVRIVSLQWTSNRSI